MADIVYQITVSNWALQDEYIWLDDSTNNEPLTLTNGNEAANARTNIQREVYDRCCPHHKVSVKKVSLLNADEWHKREMARFADGTYREVPWAHALTPIDGHYVHMALEKDGVVAYTPNPISGAEDRQVRMTPGRYLERFFSAHITSDQVRSWANECSLLFIEPYRIARTPKEIARVYTHGPHSCMSGPKNNYSTRPYHPVEVYGHSDLGVAFLASCSFEAGEKIHARVLVYPEAKLYARVYGDGGSYSEHLINQLKASGYRQSRDFSGAKIRLLRNDHKQVILPYFDIQNRCICIDDETFELVSMSATKWDYFGGSESGIAVSYEDYEDE